MIWFFAVFGHAKAEQSANRHADCARQYGRERMAAELVDCGKGEGKDQALYQR